MKTPHTETVQPVAASGLCTMCGVCAAVCPRNCIHMEVTSCGECTPVIEDRECVACGLCLRVCPGREVAFEELAGGLSLGEQKSDVLGRYARCYVGHVADDGLRRRCSSGGVATGLLLHALRTGQIEGAVVARMRPDRPLRSEMFLATSTDEILLAAGSKYCPVAAGDALREAIRRPAPFAMVGLPCHVHAVRKAEGCLPALRGHPLLIGLFCGYGKTYRALDGALRMAGMSPASVAAVEFRHGGWPGVMRIVAANGGVATLPFDAWFRRECSPSRCTLCYDGSAELADISCGDAWLPELRGSYPGTSVVVARTAKGEDLVRQAVAHGVLALKPVDGGVVVQSQRAMLPRKKRLIGAHMVYRRMLARPVPDYGAAFSRPTFGAMAEALSLNVRIAADKRAALSFVRRLVGATGRVARGARRAGQ